MKSAPSQTAGEKFQLLVDLMARLRAPGGCPWDREQTFETIKPFLLEETYEVMDAIDARDWKELAGELGDLMLQAVFFSQMAGEQNLFRIEDAIDAINQKLVRRHPHVFGDQTAETEGDVRRIWGEVKATEKEGDRALLDSVPRALPALVEARQISTRVAHVGFDWPSVEQVLEKLREELRELDEARASGSREKMEHEIGDLLFSVVNLARKTGVDARAALEKANGRFVDRFRKIEALAAERGIDVARAGLNKLDELWEEAKEGRKREQ